VQYSTAFALLAQICPADAQRSITHLTLIAGLASTIFLADRGRASGPFHMATGLFGLRDSALVFCMPLHF